ncbi:MAG: metal ABC transporter substrate-binding protein [Candidatus Sumerlaeia bacterium]
MFTKSKIILCALFLAAVLLLLPAVLFADKDNATSIITGSSMLEKAIDDLFDGIDNAPEVTTLIPPGSCPGHFDLSPRVLPALKKATLVLRHDYQAVLEDKIRRIGGKDIPIMTVDTPASLLIPDNYLKLKKDVLPILEKKYPEEAQTLKQNLKHQTEDTEALVKDLQDAAKNLKGLQVIASFHQKAFAEWLGCEVVDTIRRPEDMSARDLQRLVQQDGIVAIIANLQEGTQAAESLGEKMDKPVIVFSNFADAPGYGESYEDLLRENLKRLKKAISLE